MDRSRDAEVIAELSNLVHKHPSRGFGKYRHCLRRTRPEWNHKRIYRGYKAMKLNLRRAGKRRLPKRDRVPLYEPKLPDKVWSMDFNREVLHIEVDRSINSLRLIRVFEQLKRDHGLPQVVRSDNGPEFLGESFLQWLKENGVAGIVRVPPRARFKSEGGAARPLPRKRGHLIAS